MSVFLWLLLSHGRHQRLSSVCDEPFSQQSDFGINWPLELALRIFQIATMAREGYFTFAKGTTANSYIVHA